MRDVPRIVPPRGGGPAPTRATDPSTRPRAVRASRGGSRRTCARIRRRPCGRPRGSRRSVPGSHRHRSTSLCASRPPGVLPLSCRVSGPRASHRWTKPTRTPTPTPPACTRTEAAAAGVRRGYRAHRRMDARLGLTGDASAPTVRGPYIRFRRARRSSRSCWSRRASSHAGPGIACTRARLDRDRHLRRTRPHRAAPATDQCARRAPRSGSSCVPSPANEIRRRARRARARRTEP